MAKKKMTVEKTTAIAYRQVRFSQAFNSPIGYTKFKDFADARYADEAEQRRNSKWARIKREET